MLKNISSKIGTIITLIIIIAVLGVVYKIYKSNNFNDFQRSERNLGTSQFKRDSENKYSKNDSYEIISDKYNDAMFYKNIQVEKNTPYKVSCMVKTEGIEKQEPNNAIGAQIAINASTERSTALSRYF